MFGLDDFAIAALVSTGASILSSFTAKEVEPPRSAQDEFYERMCNRFRKIRDLKKGTVKTVGVLTGKSEDELKQLFGDEPYKFDEFISEYNKGVESEKDSITGGTAQQQSQLASEKTLERIGYNDRQAEDGIIQEDVSEPIVRQMAFDKGKGQYNLQVKDKPGDGWIDYDSWSMTDTGKSFLSTDNGKSYFKKWWGSLQ